MEAWVCLLILNYSVAVFEMQNEDATVLAGKTLSSTGRHVICVNQFDGRVFSFKQGKQAP